MKLFSNVMTQLRNRRGSVIGILGGLGIALTAFFAGTWAGSSGVLMLGSGPGHASVPSAPAMSHGGKGCCDGMEKPMSPQTSEPPAPSHQMPGGEPMPGPTHPGDTHQMPGGEQMPGATHPGGTS